MTFITTASGWLTYWNVTIDSLSVYLTSDGVPVFHRSGTTHSTPKKVWKGIERKREVSISKVIATKQYVFLS